MPPEPTTEQLTTHQQADAELTRKIPRHIGQFPAEEREPGDREDGEWCPDVREQQVEPVEMRDSVRAQEVPYRPTDPAEYAEAGEQ